jgi:hypothetical protein
VFDGGVDRAVIDAGALPTTAQAAATNEDHVVLLPVVRLARNAPSGRAARVIHTGRFDTPASLRSSA